MVLLKILNLSNKNISKISTWCGMFTDKRLHQILFYFGLHGFSLPPPRHTHNNSLSTFKQIKVHLKNTSLLFLTDQFCDICTWNEIKSLATTKYCFHISFWQEIDMDYSTKLRQQDIFKEKNFSLSRNIKLLREMNICSKTITLS